MLEWHMANDKQSLKQRNSYRPVTEAKLISVLKEFRKDIQKSFDKQRKDIQKDFDKQRKDLNEDFLETLANYHNGEIIPKLNEIIKAINSLDQRLKWVKRDLKDMETEFATNMVSKKDFNRLRAEVMDIKEELKRLKTKVGLTN